jgi:aminoglycoside phosphotransferase
VPVDHVGTTVTVTCAAATSGVETKCRCMSSSATDRGSARPVAGRCRGRGRGQQEAVSRAVARQTRGAVGDRHAKLADVEDVEVIVAHSERATLRVGDVFLKIDADQTRAKVEVEAMAMAPIPTPEILWRKPPVLALAALPGTALGRLGEPSKASSAAWAAAGAAARMLHDAPLPPWPGRSVDELASELDGECEWLITNGVLPTDLVTRSRRLAETALRPWTPVFIHGDLQVDHVFVAGDEITGVLDWSEASQGDALFDLAILTLGHKEHLGDVVAGYGTDVDRDLIHAWWSLRCLTNVRWLAEHGYGSPDEFPEVAVLKSRM